MQNIAESPNSIDFIFGLCYNIIKLRQTIADGARQLQRTMEGGPERTVTEMVFPPAGGAAGDPKELSRIFQRDARRYDGGFSLF